MRSLAMSAIRALGRRRPLRLVHPTRGRGRPGLEWEVLLPVQFFAADRDAKRHRQPEVRLGFAVLADALACVCQSATTPASRRLLQETLAWFAADDGSWPFSFVNICQATGIDAVA